MFEQTFLLGAARTRRAWTVPVSFAGELCAVALVAVLPLIFTEKLPRSRLLVPPLTAPVRLGSPNPGRGTVVQVVTVVRETRPGRFTAPAAIPDKVPVLSDPEEVASAPVFSGPPCSGPACGVLGDPNGVVGAPPPFPSQMAAPPPPFVPPVRAEPVKVAPARPAIVNVGGNVQQAKLTNRLVPSYPKLAITARISGVVQLAAIIGTDGRVRELRVLFGHPVLVPAAVEAVRQWTYSPTLLNGTPVEVATEITVEFTLNR